MKMPKEKKTKAHLETRGTEVQAVCSKTGFVGNPADGVRNESAAQCGYPREAPARALLWLDRECTCGRKHEYA